jgi:hypothetical protein
MTEEHGEGLGLAIRLFLDSLDNEDLGHANTQADTTRISLLQAAANVRSLSRTGYALWRAQRFGGASPPRCKCPSMPSVIAAV